MDPAFIVTDQDLELGMNVYQTLVGYDYHEDASGTYTYQGDAVVPEIAQSWVFQGNKAILNIRRGLKFYPSGNPVTAADAVFSLRRALAETAAPPELNSSGIFQPGQIKQLGTYKLEISYTNTAGQPVVATDFNLATLRFPFLGIVDSKTVLAHATEKDPYATAWLKNHVAGTGPYYVASRTTGQSLTLKAVPNLWSAEPKFKTVKLEVINSANAESLIQGGALNVGLFGLSPSDANTLKSDGFRVINEATPDNLYLQIAEDKGPFANPLIRRAIADAIPYNEIIHDVYYGQAKRSYSFTSKYGQGYVPAWESYGSLAKAKVLMKDAGDPRISTTLNYDSDTSSYFAAAQLIKSALAQIGITVTLVPHTTASIFSFVENRASASEHAVGDNDGMVLMNLSIYIDDAKGPVSFFFEPGTLDWPHFDDPTVTALEAKYQTAPRNAARAAAYETIQKIAAADASFIPVATIGETLVSAKSITGLAFEPVIGMIYWLLKPAS
jgi:peptide/nickel transport system substrate-binding protein